MLGMRCTRGNPPFVFQYIMRTYEREDEIFKEHTPRVLALICYRAVFSVVTQRFSPLFCGEERFVTTLKTVVYSAIQRQSET